MSDSPVRMASPAERLMKKVVFSSGTFRFAIFALFLTAIPFVVYGSKRAWDSTANRVEDWLPSSFEETQKLLWFVGHFGSDEVLMVSWPGCTLDDPRLPRLAAELLKPGPGLNAGQSGPGQAGSWPPRAMAGQWRCRAGMRSPALAGAWLLQIEQRRFPRDIDCLLILLYSIQIAQYLSYIQISQKP